MESIDTLSAGTNKENRRAHWLSHIENWKASNLKQEAYCAQAKINLNTFTYWRGVFLSESSPKKDRKFLPIKLVTTESHAQEAPRAIQIKLLSGHSVYLPSTMDINDISKIIHYLGEPHA